MYVRGPLSAFLEFCISLPKHRRLSSISKITGFMDGWMMDRWKDNSSSAHSCSVAQSRAENKKNGDKHIVGYSSVGYIVLWTKWGIYSRLTNIKSSKKILGRAEKWSAEKKNVQHRRIAMLHREEKCSAEKSKRARQKRKNAQHSRQMLTRE